MRKNYLWAVALIVIIAVGYAAYTNQMTTNQSSENEGSMVQESLDNITITPIEHATAVLTLGDTVFYTDPVGGAEQFEGQPDPDAILITDIHGDHLDIDTLEDVVAEDTVLIVPQAVADQLPAVPGKTDIPLASRVIILENGKMAPHGEFQITAIPMYNLPESEEAFHVKGRGNGYLIEREGMRIYISGDTADIPEMRALRNIDLAFISMNLPYTMDVEAAADAVLEFKPRSVTPYHYRGTEGLSDIERFKEIVNAGDPNIDVMLLDWYPNGV